MSKNTTLWSAVWSVVKFILTLGLSHISKREDRLNKNNSNN